MYKVTHVYIRNSYTISHDITIICVLNYQYFGGNWGNGGGVQTLAVQ